MPKRSRSDTLPPWSPGPRMPDKDIVDDLRATKRLSTILLNVIEKRGDLHCAKLRRHESFIRFLEYLEARDNYNLALSNASSLLN